MLSVSTGGQGLAGVLARFMGVSALALCEISGVDGCATCAPLGRKRASPGAAKCPRTGHRPCFGRFSRSSVFRSIKAPPTPN